MDLKSDGEQEEALDDSIELDPETTNVSLVNPCKTQTKEESSILLSKAKMGSVEAQDEIVKRYFWTEDYSFHPDRRYWVSYDEVIRMTREDIQTWDTIKEKALQRDYYAHFVLGMTDPIVSENQLQKIFDNLLKRTNKSKSPISQTIVASIHSYNKDSGLQEVHKWLLLAAKQGFEYATSWLEFSFSEHNDTSEEAERWWLYRIDNRDPESEYCPEIQLAYLYKERMDYEKAADWFERYKSIVKFLDRQEEAYFLSVRELSYLQKWGVPCKVCDYLFKSDLFTFQPDEPVEEGTFEEMAGALFNIMSPMTNFHELRSLQNDPEGKYVDCRYGIPQLSEWHQVAHTVGQEICELLGSLSKAKPGLWVSCFKFTTDVMEAVEEKCDGKKLHEAFPSLHIHGKYITLGEENVTLLKTLSAFLKGSEQKWTLMERALETLRGIYSGPLERELEKLVTLQTVLRQTHLAHEEKPGDQALIEKFNKKQDKFKKKKAKYEKLERILGPDIKTLDEHLNQLSHVKEEVKGLLNKGLGRRNREFLEEYPLIKEKTEAYWGRRCLSCPYYV